MLRTIKSVIVSGLFLALGLPPLEAYALKVGVTAGPHAIIMEKVKELAQQEGLSIEIIEFNDFILPNAALDKGELDINCYQHQHFLDEQIASRGLKLVSVGKTVLMPLGIYAKALSSLDQVPEGARVAIPNDPTNGGRALLLLQEAGLLRLRNAKNPALHDIQDNPHHLDIIEIEAPQLPRILDEVSIAVINTDWVMLSGLTQKPLFQEGKDSPYANILVVRLGEEAREDIGAFKRCYQSEAIQHFITDTFKGAILPAWL